MSEILYPLRLYKGLGKWVYVFSFVLASQLLLLGTVYVFSSDTFTTVYILNHGEWSTYLVLSLKRLWFTWFYFTTWQFAIPLQSFVKSSPSSTKTIEILTQRV